MKEHALCLLQTLLGSHEILPWSWFLDFLLLGRVGEVLSMERVRFLRCQALESEVGRWRSPRKDDHQEHSLDGGPLSSELLEGALQ